VSSYFVASVKGTCLKKLGQKPSAVPPAQVFKSWSVANVGLEPAGPVATQEVTLLAMQEHYLSET